MKLNRRERVLLWILVTYALLVACASAPRPIAPEATWPGCAAVCSAQSALFLGVLFPSPVGPPICACAAIPQPAAEAPQAFWGPT